ncbi:hypothetical protein HY993_01485 [Candidatus Micrarchaeota archaeon]|nr:hypothetical protein [Candidatus Micrarchaeota archaeon]
MYCGLNELSKGISSAVRVLLDDVPFLNLGVDKEIINYSGLARMLIPRIESQVGFKVGEHAVIAAIRREMKKTHEESPSFLSLIAHAAIFVHTGMFRIDLQRNSPQLSEKLCELEKTTNQEKGERFYQIQRRTEISVIAHRRFLAQILKLIDKKDVQKITDNLAMISIKVPPDLIEVPGEFYYFTGLFARRNISIYGLIRTFNWISFLVSESQAPLAYKRIISALEQVKQFNSVMEKTSKQK